jgi:hypothetical protein
MFLRSHSPVVVVTNARDSYVFETLLCQGQIYNSMFEQRKEGKR